jgi:hypothetical protein
MTNEAKEVIAVVCLIVAFAAGRYSVPKPNIKTTSVVKSNDVKRENTVIKTHEVKHQEPTGIIVTTTDTVTTTKLDETDKTASNQITSITTEKPQWRFSGGVGYDFKQVEPQYLFGVERRVLGPVFAGGNVDVSPNFGLKSAHFTLSIEF